MVFIFSKAAKIEKCMLKNKKIRSSFETKIFRHVNALKWVLKMLLLFFINFFILSHLSSCIKILMGIKMSLLDFKSDIVIELETHILS
jgi:hypothetical protein